jgi:hypothetical protein
VNVSREREDLTNENDQGNYSATMFGRVCDSRQGKENKDAISGRVREKGTDLIGWIGSCSQVVLSCGSSPLG